MLVSISKNECWFFLKLHQWKLFIILPHIFSCLCCSTWLRYNVVSFCSKINSSRVWCIYILFQIFFKLTIFFVSACFADFFFNTLWNKIANFKLTLLLLYFLFCFDHSCPLVLRNFILHFFELFLGISFNLLNSLILSFDLIFIGRKSLPPTILDKLNEFILLLLLVGLFFHLLTKLKPRDLRKPSIISRGGCYLHQSTNAKDR